jgi:FAD dependent oxidoreductase
MRRRDLLSFGPYSVLVAGGALSAQNNPITTSTATKAPGPEPHMRYVELNTDLVVAGGGLAGVCAAISAARHGAKVVLIQDRSRLGGNSSSEVKMHVVGASNHKGRPGWRESGLLEEIRLDDACNNPQRCWEMWDLLLYDKVISEPNITLLLETAVYSAEMKDGKIQSVLARSDKSEHIYHIKAPIFLDSTGDSRLGLESGAEMRTGREGRGEFGESLAPEKGDNSTLGSSILFTSKLNRNTMPFTPPKWARKLTSEDLKFRQITSWEYGYWWIEWGGDHDLIHDNDKIRHELLAIVMGVWDYIKNSGEFPNSAFYALDWVGMMPGKRGGRRLMGDHIVTQQELVAGGPYPDAIAIGGWPLDDHTGMDFDHHDVPPLNSIKIANPYNIPLRSLYSKNVPNLLMAGRNISCSHVAFTSTRVMATCAVIGQAAGTAAALCLEKGVLPRQLATEPKLTSSLQQRLLRDDQTIIGVKNQDPNDLARKASVTASSEAGDNKAMLIQSGFTRDIPKQEVHHWAAPMSPEGAWIELRWPTPQRIRELQITFDTGFQRELTLTAQDSVNNGTIRAPQPETVKDYSVTASGKTVVSVKDNHQRLRRHKFEPVETASLRLHITATQGDELARVFEIRCYS